MVLAGRELAFQFLVQSLFTDILDFDIFRSFLRFSWIQSGGVSLIEAGMDSAAQTNVCLQTKM